MKELLITIIKILLLILILGFIINFINGIDKKNKKESYECNADEIDIDNLVIINGNPEYRKLVDKLIDEKKYMFDEDELKIMKNPNQFYLVSKDGKIKNVSNTFYKNCANKLDSISGTRTELFENITNEDLELVGSREYDNISKEFKESIAKTLPPDTTNSAVLSDPKYLKNYYLDLYGNNVKSDLIDYYTAYYTTINKDLDECLPVDTLVGKPNFIIPDQYSIEKYLTNAYNVDWSRIVNPYTIL